MDNMIKELDVVFENPFKKRIEYFIEDKSVGYLEYLIMYDRMEIENIFVDEKYRHQGIGNKLMSYLISIAIETRVVNITLEVRETNEPAKRLYKKFGFREVALRHNYYGNENGILMEKQVM